ncbi:MAG: hypothetical protein Q4B65_00485 [Candidatus Saccharibacteria bacterium]|nr:hypothetical protein [Candidatus Saccharibacteria bacterium]
MDDKDFKVPGSVTENSTDAELKAAFEAAPEKKNNTMKILAAVLGILLAVAVGVIIWLLVAGTGNNVSDNSGSTGGTMSGGSTSDSGDAEETPIELSTNRDSEAYELVETLHGGDVMYSTRFNGGAIMDSGGYLYVSGNITSAELSNEYKLAIASWALEAYEDSDSYEEVIPAEELVEEAREIFGENTELALVSFESCAGRFEFDATRNSFNWKVGGCGGTLIGSSAYVRKIASAKQYTNRLEVEEKAGMVKFEFVDVDQDGATDDDEAFMDVYNVYGTNLISDNIEYSWNYEEAIAGVINKYADQFDTFKYTFTLENGEWVFEKIEKI